MKCCAPRELSTGSTYYRELGSALWKLSENEISELHTVGAERHDKISAFARRAELQYTINVLQYAAYGFYQRPYL